MSNAGGSVGPYVLGAEVGRGASGIVYAATDSKLGRKVALKVLSDDVASTSEQRARFAREARLLAAVSHPNVATVYGVVEEGEHVWLALEFLEGETLADELARGPLPMREALDAARQIADGLEAAHESGVVHRDLKPANVKRGRDGVVKVLDFGLAKPVRAELSDSSEFSSDGLVLGTPLYMSPEQLRGRSVDRRADVWAFGCVLWEFLTGARAFGGETTADVLHAILEVDPDPRALPANTPARVRDLLSRCLRKDARQRLRDVGDARLELEAALAERAWVRGNGATDSGAAAGSRRPGWMLPVVAIALTGIVGLLAGRFSNRTPATPQRVLRLALDVPAGPKRTHPRVAPDGSALVHEVSVNGTVESRHLVLRRFDAFEDVPIPGTERVDTYGFSPDGKTLAVARVVEGVSGRFELVLVRLNGSEPPRFIGALPPNLSASGALCWLDGDRVVLATRPRNLLIVHTDGSGRMSEIPMTCDEEVWPQAPDILDSLPGSHSVLASALEYSGRSVLNHIVRIDVETGEQTVLLENSRNAAWSPPGLLLYTRADVLFAVPYDAETGSVGDEPIRLAGGLRTDATWLSAQFHASREGTIAWLPGGMLGADRGLSWVRPGEPPEPWSSDSLALEGFLDIDDTGAFVTTVVAGPSGNYELWGSAIDVPRLRPLRADPRYDYYSACVFLKSREMIVSRYGQGAAEVLRAPLDDVGDGVVLLRDTREGRRLTSLSLLDEGRLLAANRSGPEGPELVVCELAGEPPYEPRTIFDGSQSQRSANLSSDARWLLVRDQNEPATVRRFHSDGTLGKSWLVPTPAADVRTVMWAHAHPRDAYRLFIMPPENTTLLEVEMREGPDGPEFTDPRTLLDLPDHKFWDAVHVRGDEFLTVLVDRDQDAQDTVYVTIGALDELGDE